MAGEGGEAEENATRKIIVNCDSPDPNDSIATGLTIINVRANASVFTVFRERKFATSS